MNGKRFLVILMLSAAPLGAQTVPPLLNYQGRLTDGFGAPVANGMHGLVFSIYAAPCGLSPCGDTPVWGPATINSLVVNGAFNVVLGNDGDGDPISQAFAAADRYVEISVDGAPPILPRQQVLSAPYALRAGGGDHGAMDGLLDDDHPQYLLGSEINVPYLESTSANMGIYDNRIANLAPPLAYTEVCAKGGVVVSDIHSVSESTAGGACIPGDIGWIIEKNERPAESWVNARMACLLAGMRLPEPFEFQYSCVSAGGLGLADLADDSEWSSNEASVLEAGGAAGVAVTAMGAGGSCSGLILGWVGRTAPLTQALPFRCVR